VQPSFLEGFGLPPLEAAAHGTPAVVSALDCFAETLGDAALRVPPGDADALAEAMLQIAGDEALRARLGAAARERAAAYTWERSANALHALLAEAT
jgi:glycosyltransferase involved in cell wall biosynthesis